MLFPTFAFLLFFLVVVAGVAALDHHFTAKKALLVAASYFFYAFWSWKLAFLLLGSVLLNWGIGRLIGLAERAVGRVLARCGPRVKPAVENIVARGL